MPSTDLPIDLRRAHDHASDHRSAVKRSDRCGCFYCLRTFAPDEVVWGVYSDRTGACPHCGIDAVLGSARLPLTLELLHAMHERWFA